MELLTIILEFCLLHYFAFGFTIAISILLVVLRIGYSKYEKRYARGSNCCSMEYYLKDEFDTAGIWTIALTPIAWPLVLLGLLIILAITIVQEGLPWFAKKLENRVKRKYPENQI
jgi:hypothetical protein